MRRKTMTKKPKKGEPGLDYYYVLPEIDIEGRITNAIDNIRKELFEDKSFKDDTPVCTQIIIVDIEAYNFHKYLNNGY